VIADAIINAAHNFWGAASGPTHPNNPGGSGDPIVDGANGGSGTVIFDPFLMSPSAQSAFCQLHGAPVMQGPGLVLLVLGLLILPSWRRRAKRMQLIRHPVERSSGESGIGHRGTDP
jgi:hypothetical protein